LVNKSKYRRANTQPKRSLSGRNKQMWMCQKNKE